MSASRNLFPVCLALAGCAATAPNPKPAASSVEWTDAGTPAASEPLARTEPVVTTEPPGPAAPLARTEPVVTTEPPGPAAPLASDEHNGKSGQWEFTASASGMSDKNFEAGSGAGNVSLGVYLGDYFELAARQSVSFADGGDNSPSNTNASTALAADIVFFSEGFRPFLGADVGYIYGDSVHETWVGGPEGGFKMYLKQDVFLQLLAQYQFFFQKGDEIDDQFNDGSFVYSLALGINF